MKLHRRSERIARRMPGIWPINLILSHQTNNAVKVEPSPLWDLNRVEGDRF
jgi:hypothetical protein